MLEKNAVIEMLKYKENLSTNSVTVQQKCLTDVQRSRPTGQK